MVQLILDTDIGGDCDDAGAMAVMHALGGQGLCEILAVTHCTSRDSGPACVDAVNLFYGREDIPVGTFLPDGFLDEGEAACYGKRIQAEYEHRYPSKALCEDAVRVLRRTLAGARDGAVTVAAIGPLGNMARLLASPPDAQSPLEGAELVRRKVRELCVMGGIFDRENDVKVEWNIQQDIPAAARVAKDWPSPVVYCPFELGLKVITGRALLRQGAEYHPVRRAYELMDTQGRESWDPCTVLYAVCGAGEWFSLSPAGDVCFDGWGVSSFAAREGGRDRVLSLRGDPKALAETLDALMMAPAHVKKAGAALENVV